MRITFLMPGYMWGPSGGYRVIYEYANQLVDRGHQVSVVHPRRLKYLPTPNLPLRERLRRAKFGLVNLFSTPVIDWQPIDKRVKLSFVSNSGQRNLPDADVLFATAWQTVPSVLRSSQAKGGKFYLIQGYETWMGPKDLVDQTWLAPINKVVVARWLLELGNSMGANNLTHIPIAINHSRYRVLRPIQERPRQVVMALSWVAIKGSKDGIAALQIAKKEFPDLRVVLFGNSRRPPWVPQWMIYEHDPPQQRIVEKFYNGSSVVVSSSIAEGFALPAAEGAACGCAIAATDSGGIRDFAEHGVTALLSPPKDPEALARNICVILGNDDLRIRLARSANDFIKQFTWERSANLMERFLFRAVQPKPLGQLSNSSIEVIPA